MIDKNKLIEQLGHFSERVVAIIQDSPELRNLIGEIERDTEGKMSFGVEVTLHVPRQKQEDAPEQKMSDEDFLKSFRINPDIGVNSNGEGN